jgi:hypothetical protein
VFFDESVLDQFLHGPSYLAISPVWIGPRPHGSQATFPPQLGQGEGKNGLIPRLDLMQEIDIQLEGGRTQVAVWEEIDVGHTDR